MPPVRDGTERPLRHGLLSYAQEGLWLVSQFDPSGAYNNILVIRFQGRLNILTLEQSVNEIVRRHESLRTRFRLINGTPHQIVEPDGHVDLHIVDLRGDTDPKLEQALARAAEVGREPFDLGRSAMRCLVLRLSAEDHLLVVSLHHIVSDGTSVTIFMRELVMLYSAFVRGEPSPLEDLPAQYLDFVALQRERLSPDRLVAGIEFWKRQLAGAPAVLDLPCDRPRPPAQTFRGGIRSIQLSEGLTQGLRSLVRQNKATLYMAFLAAWQLLLYRYTGQEDLVVGTPMTLRRRKEFQPVMGYFANALALRAAITGDKTFTQLLRSVRDTALAAYQHSDIPFDKVVQALRPPRARSHHPIFQVLLAFNERGAGQLEASHFTISDLEVSFPQFDAGTSRFDLTLCVHEGIESLVLDLEYSSDLFEAATIEAMAGHLCLLLEAMIADPNLTVARVPLLTDWERHRQLVEWNDTRVAHPTGGLVHELFEEQVRREPHAVALVHEDRRWTYGDLNTEANRLAWRLRSLGVGPETFVGLHVQRGFEMVAGLLGVLKAGGAYIGLDPNDGEDRARFIIDDLGVRAILTEARLAAALPRTAATVLPIESSSGRTVESPSVADPPRLGSDRHLAYAIYTSGSTGTPKAVGIEHASAVSFLHWAGRAFGRDGLSGVLATTAPTFDCTLFEVLAPLSWGGTVVLANSVLDLPVTSGVKLVHTVPSAIAGLLESGGIPSSVETLALTGEALPGALLSDIFRLTGIRRVFNFYGASEATTFTTRGTFTTAEVKGLVGEEGENAEPPTPTIGRPIDNVRTYVLDRSLNLVPRGVIGELCIGGAGVARGYINRLALTDERFIADPFSAEPGARLYRTGDLARYRANGDLEFLGRIDRQVKVRGFRIELGEVEFALERHPAVRQAAVIVREEQPGGDRHLVAYVVPQEPPGTAPSELRAHLAHNLPAFMVPSRFVSLDRLPLTSSGKVDRRALPAPERPRTSTSEEWQPPDYVAAELANIWRTLLDVDSVNPEDDFFDLGGHSILALGAVWRIREASAGRTPAHDLGHGDPVPGGATDGPACGSLPPGWQLHRWPDRRRNGPPSGRRRGARCFLGPDGHDNL